MTLARINSGKRGEDLALSYLRKEGYKIIQKNYKTKIGEIDIIGKDKDYISFVEVRSKNTLNFGLPEDTVTKNKQMQIARVALTYIKKHKLEDELCRFDVVCIDNVDSAMPNIKLIKDAFQLDNQYRY